MIVRARFIAEIGDQKRFAEVGGDGAGLYRVVLADESQETFMPPVLVTSDFAEAVRRAREWMDSIRIEGEG